jgi:glucose/arabinose dehydrogenase
MNHVLPRLVAFILAAVVTGGLASIVQTQFNLASLVAFGAPVTPSLRALTTFEDLGRFGPVMAGIAAVALLPAFIIAHVVGRVVHAAWHKALLMLAGVCGMAVAFWLMASVIPMPPLSAIRRLPGFVSMSLTGLAGGAVYAAALAASQRRMHAGQSRLRRVATAVAIALVPVIAFVVMAPPRGTVPVFADPSTYRVLTVATGLERPWSVAFLPDGRTLVTEMRGRLRVVRGDGTMSDIALDGMPAGFHEGGVAGLMEVMPDPDFAQNRWLYLTLSYGAAGANGTRLVRGTLNGDRVQDVRILFNGTRKTRAGNNGGRMAFLGDGTLVLTVGDGNLQREAAQTTSDHLGTVIRIDKDGRAPADNPFVQVPGALPEIYSLGHRNAQGIAVDPATGDLLVSEHGPRGGDEINRIVAGGNYGWPIVTGGIDYPYPRVSPFKRLEGYRDADLEWTPSIAPAGLAIYRGALFPEWSGDLLVPALKERSVRRVIRKDGRIIGQELLLADLKLRMRDVKVAPDGSVYVLTDGTDAKLLRLVPPAAALAESSAR